MLCFCNVKTNPIEYVSAMLKLILLSYDHVNIGRFYESCGNHQNGFNNTSFTVRNKASNMAMSVS